MNIKLHPARPRDSLLHERVQSRELKLQLRVIAFRFVEEFVDDLLVFGFLGLVVLPQPVDEVDVDAVVMTVFCVMEPDVVLIE